MDYLIAGVPNDNDLASFIGKKGSANGITFYNRKTEGIKLAALTPTDLNDKFYTLGQVLSMSEVIVISTKSVDKMFAECVIGASLLAKPIILTNSNDVDAMLKPIQLRVFAKADNATMLEALTSFKKSQGDKASPLRIDIDHAFPVKGVGTVLLGIVRSGKVKAHDNLVISNGKQVSVRSIQVQDDDVQEAGAGARVGLAVKGVEHDEVEKGDILAEKRVEYADKITAGVELSSMSGNANVESETEAIVSGFSFANCKGVTKSGDEYVFELDKKVALDIGDRFIVIRKNSPRLFCAGTVKAKA